MSESTSTKKDAAQYLSAWVTPLLLLLLSAGLLLLGFTLAPTHSLQKYLNIAFMDDLKTTSTTAGLNIVQKEIDTESSNSQTFEKGKVVPPKFGEQYAILECKDIELKVGVYFGVNSELLALGACQSSNSAILGMGGNTVIDAHVNTFFSDLHNMEVGDTVTLYTEYGNFTYKVKEQIAFEKTDKRYVTKTEEDCLTLYTCKAQVLGNSDERIGVRCELVSQEFYEAADAET